MSDGDTRGHAPTEQASRFIHGREIELLGEGDVAVGVLEMLMAADQWVHRRVEQVEIETQAACTRRVSLDLTMPNPCDSQVEWLDGKLHTLVPVDLLAKQPLQHFSISDAEGRPLPTLTRRQNGELAFRGLAAIADSAMRKAGLTSRPSWVDYFQRVIAQFAGRRAHAAIRVITRWADFDPHARALSRDAGWRTYAYALADNFILVAVADYSPGERAIVKYSHEVSLRLADHRSAAQKRREMLSLEPSTWEFGVSSFTDCESFHFEASAPDGIELIDAVLVDRSRTVDGQIDPEWAAGFNPVAEHSRHRAHVSVSRTSDPNTRIREFATPYVSVNLRIERDGWLRSSAIASAVVAAFFAASWPWVLTLGTSRSSGLNTDPAAFTVTLLGVISLVIVRSGEHSFTARLVRPLRYVALSSAAVSLAGAWLLVFPGPGRLLRWGWSILTVVAVAVTGVIWTVYRRRPYGRADPRVSG